MPPVRECRTAGVAVQAGAVVLELAGERDGARLVQERAIQRRLQRPEPAEVDVVGALDVDAGERPFGDIEVGTRDVATLVDTKSPVIEPSASRTMFWQYRGCVPFRQPCIETSSGTMPTRPSVSIRNQSRLSVKFGRNCGVRVTPKLMRVSFLGLEVRIAAGERRALARNALRNQVRAEAVAVLRSGDTRVLALRQRRDRRHAVERRAGIRRRHRRSASPSATRTAR